MGSIKYLFLLYFASIVHADVTFHSEDSFQIQQHRIWRLHMASLIDSTLPFKKTWNGAISFKFLAETFHNSHRVDIAYQNETQTRDYFGDFVLFSQRFQNNYGHVFHDHLPQISWLTQNTNAKIFLMDTPLNRIFTKCFFNDISQRFIFSKTNKKQNVFGSISTYELSDPRSYSKEMYNVHYHVAFYKQKLKNSCLSNDHGKVIYCSRNSSQVKHSRKMNVDNERQIIELLLNKFGDRLVVFNGQDEHGKKIPVYDQARLFSSADVVIGPHGSGMSNIGWMDWSTKNPRKKVIEFVCSESSKQVQSGCPFYRTYAWMFGTLNSIDYHHIAFTEYSTADETYISLKDLETVLRVI